ncbi:mannobiose 2-epimerase [Ruminococcaceae bacterium FB2012]|nr:mannobiose 2-epimerase [Ruminococcaceae bacterium FB2012]
MIISEVRSELENHIVPFWAGLKDEENGGFYGFMSCGLELDKKAEKGVILHSRILWFFSKCYTVLKDEKYRELAFHAFEYVKNHCIDYDNGGVYWMTDFKGVPSDTMKHTYNIAFAVYALSCYYNAVGDRFALDLAYKLFSDIEENTRDEYGYREAFTVDWQLIPNDALSENGLMADKTMNTVLHLIEAYTELYKAGHSERVRERLCFLLGQVKDKVFDPERNALKVFFDTKLDVIGDIHSYGHDIEASWLIDLACDTLGDRELIRDWSERDLKISENILNIAFEGGALNNERENEKIDRTRVWWVQAEAVVGFTNAYQHSGDKKFLDAARTVWAYIKEHIIDKRPGGEWYSELTFEGEPHDWKETVGPWKCPYHNGRMCMELISRGVDF